jgi:lysophospholipase L1-like esterase
MRLRSLLRLLAALALALALAAAGGTASAAQRAGAGLKWVSGWTASPHGPYPSGFPFQPLPLGAVFPGEQADNQTLRLIVHLSQGGKELRLHLSNLVGTQTVTFGEVTIGARSSGADVSSGTLHQVLFGGQASVSVPAGGEVVSDPVDLSTTPQEDLAVSIYVAGASGPMTWHAKAVTTSYATLPNTGDHAGEAAGTSFTEPMRSWFFLNAIDVTVPPNRESGTIVALGDSITDGTQSTVDGNDRWPDDLARRLLGATGGLKKEVVNEGIGGNRVVTDAGPGGPSALSRLDRDVFARPNLTDLIVFEGVNDIGNGATASDVIGGLEQIIARAHARGINAIGATITPYEGSYTAPDAIRQTVNEWIRTSGAFDHMVDFDAIVRDPTHPSRIDPMYDPGDHIHLNPAGYAAIANAIPLSWFDDRPNGHHGGNG